MNAVAPIYDRITSTVDNYIEDGKFPIGRRHYLWLPIPNHPKQPGKLDYAYIQDIHRLLTTNVALIGSLRLGGCNGHLGIVLSVTQYALVRKVPFVRPTNPGQTPTIPA